MEGMRYRNALISRPVKECKVRDVRRPSDNQTYRKFRASRVPIARRVVSKHHARETMSLTARATIQWVFVWTVTGRMSYMS